MTESQPNKNELIMRTENPVHEGDFKWIIEHVSKFSRRLRSDITPESECKPEFQLVAKFNESYPEVRVNNVQIGVQRTDSDVKTVHVTIDIQLCNSDGDLYNRKEISFKSSAGTSPLYLFSELFSDSANGLVVPKPKTGISCDDDFETMYLQMKQLISSHENVGTVFILPSDVLVIQGHIKTFGCCVVTNKLAAPSVPEKLTPQAHVDYLLRDFKQAFDNGLQTDIKLVVGDETIKAHKFVLQSRSSVFRRMFDYNTKEKEDASIVITDVDYFVLKAMVRYLYSGSIEELPYEDMCDLFEAADKYEVYPLMRACSEILRSFISDDSVCRILVLADMHNDPALKEQALQYITHNFIKVKSTEEWEMTMGSHQKVASEVLAKISNLNS